MERYRLKSYLEEIMKNHAISFIELVKLKGAPKTVIDTIKKYGIQTISVAVSEDYNVSFIEEQIKVFYEEEGYKCEFVERSDRSKFYIFNNGIEKNIVRVCPLPKSVQITVFDKP